MENVMDTPGARQPQLVYHWRNLLNDLKRSESPRRKLTRRFQMEVAGIQPNLIANFELFIGKAGLPCYHCLLRTFVRDYRLISVRRELF